MKRFVRQLLICAVFLCTACSSRFDDEYVSHYQYLNGIRATNRDGPHFAGDAEYFLVVLVDARHLDYSSPRKYFSTIGEGLFFNQDPNTGHAWIVLVGKENGNSWFFEGGHTGEFGLYAPRYFDEIVRLSREKVNPNPAQYLFTSLPDGCLQQNSGGHVPTFAAAFPLNEQGFWRVRRLLTPEGYDFSRWGIQGPNCLRFVKSCLAAINLEVPCSETIVLPHSFRYKGEEIHLWSDPAFSVLTVDTPELLEKRLWELVKEGKGQAAIKWYKNTQRLTRIPCSQLTSS